MSQAAATKPAPTEHAPEFSKYVTLVAEGDIIQTLEQQIENSLSLLRTISSDKANFRYAPDKWSVKELLGHVIDSERFVHTRKNRWSFKVDTHSQEVHSVLLTLRGTVRCFLGYKSCSLN